MSDPHEYDEAAAKRASTSGAVHPQPTVALVIGVVLGQW
jgi:hypothetical protein